MRGRSWCQVAFNLQCKRCESDKRPVVDARGGDDQVAVYVGREGAVQIQIPNAQARLWQHAVRVHRANDEWQLKPTEALNRLVEFKLGVHECD